MEREILFRGLTDGEAPTWVYGCLVNNLWKYSDLAKYPEGSSVCEIITGEYEGDCWEDIAEQENDAIVTVITESVGQYTGIKDKNNKKIYEGDVILINNEKRAPVVFDNSCFRTPYKDSHYRLGGWITDSIEVIGNIHQNPELIPTKE